MIVNNTLNDTNSVFYPLSAILHPCGGEASIHYHSWIFLNIPFHLLYFLVRNLLSFMFVYIEMCSQCGINAGWLLQMIATSQSMKTAIFQLDWVPLWVRWCGVAGAGMCGVHMLYIHTVITPSCSTIVMVDKHTGLILHRIQCNHLKGYIEVTPLMFCNCMDFLSLFNKNS